MKRITVNKEGFLMTMLELAYNSCYVKNGKARYRDREKDIDARDLARILIKQHLGEEAPQGDRELDDYISNYLQYEVYSLEGLIAVFYRSVCALADLRERLKEYEDMEESDRLVRLPCAVGDTVYAVTRGFVSELCVNRICVFKNSVWCDWTIIEGIYPNVKGFRSDEIGETVFLTRAEAEEKLRQPM